jgi:putative uncharacterized protein FNV1995
MNFIEQKINDINFDYKITNIILNSITTKRIDYSLIKGFDTHSTFEGTNIINSIVPIWVINLALGEARRVTIPASIVIACLRKILNYEKNNREV